MKTKNILLVSKPNGKKAFTLVELIIVITILAILATISFISFKNYARDGNKLTTLSNIEKWLSLYQINWKLSNPRWCLWIIQLLSEKYDM